MTIKSPDNLSKSKSKIRESCEAVTLSKLVLKVIAGSLNQADPSHSATNKSLLVSAQMAAIRLELELGSAFKLTH